MTRIILVRHGETEWNREETWLRTPSRVGPPGGEPLRAVQGRALAAVQSLARTHVDGTVVAVAHTW